MLGRVQPQFLQPLPEIWVIKDDRSNSAKVQEQLDRPSIFCSHGQLKTKSAQVCSSESGLRESNRELLFGVKPQCFGKWTRLLKDGRSSEAPFLPRAETETL